MRISYAVILLLTLSACDQNGGVMPVDGKNLLSSFDGPKIQSMQETQREAAKNAEKNNDFAQASQIYQQILEKDPETTDVIQLLADSLRRNAEYDKAISVYDGMLTKDANNLAAKEGKALALLAKSDFETPTGLFEDVLKADGRRWKSLNGMGVLFVTRGLYTDAIKYFEEAIKQSPNNTSILNNLGLALALNKQYEPAIDILSKASAQSTIGSFGRKRIDLNLALVYASAGKLGEARKIAEIYLSGPALSNNLGLYAHLAKDDGLAKSYLNMALTESKTYYGKAWDNLETLSTNVRKAGSKNELKDSDDKVDNSAEDKPKSKKTKTKNPEKEEKRITITPEPPATKSEVKSLGEIMARELKKNDKEQALPNSPPALVNKPAIDNAIDGMAKSDITDTAKDTIKYTEKSLGTIRIPSNKEGGGAVFVPNDNAEEKQQ